MYWLHGNSFRPVSGWAPRRHHWPDHIFLPTSPAHYKILFATIFRVSVSNTGLLLKSLNSLVETKVSVSPDTFCTKYPNQDSVDNILQELRTKVCAYKVTSTSCKEKVLKNISIFRSHAERVKVQFLALKDLKSSLSPQTLIIQMDFAENFNCSAGDRNVQSSYWNPLSVTLHPVIVYFREEVGGELKKKSLRYMSALNKHNTSMVLSIIKSLLLRDIKELISRLHVTHVHYMTDSPVSQYRNKFLFFTVSNNLTIFGVAATWHYFKKGMARDRVMVWVAQWSAEQARRLSTVCQWPTPPSSLPGQRTSPVRLNFSLSPGCSMTNPRRT